MAEAALVIINSRGHAGLLTAHNTIHTYTDIHTEKHKKKQKQCLTREDATFVIGRKLHWLFKGGPIRIFGASLVSQTTEIKCVLY